MQKSQNVPRPSPLSRRAQQRASSMARLTPDTAWMPVVADSVSTESVSCVLRWLRHKMVKEHMVKQGRSDQGAKPLCASLSG